MARGILPRHFFGTLVAMLILFSAAIAIEASDNSTVSYGANQNITAFSTCKKVTNNSSTNLSVYVPTQTSAEWASFYSNPPAGVSADACSCAAQSISWSTNCSGTSPALSDGASSTVSNTTPNYTGSVQSICTNGVLSQSSPTCAPAHVWVYSPNQCYFPPQIGACSYSPGQACSSPGTVCYNCGLGTVQACTRSGGSICWRVMCQ